MRRAKRRTGTLVTAHGAVSTPDFMPVGTRATVKAVGVDDLDAVGARMVLANTYHLMLRPGAEVIASLGEFTDSWDGMGRCSPTPGVTRCSPDPQIDEEE